METQATVAGVPNPTSKSQNADKNSKLDRYKAADNADNSRYEKTRRRYASVRKIAQKAKLLQDRPSGPSISEGPTIIPVHSPSPRHSPLHLLGPLACAIVPPNPSLHTRRA